MSPTAVTADENAMTSYPLPTTFADECARDLAASDMERTLAAAGVPTDDVRVVNLSRLIDESRIVEIERVDVERLRGKRAYRFAKRAFDIAAGSFAVVVCAIPMLVIAALVKADSPGPVFYRQERLDQLNKVKWF